MLLTYKDILYNARAPPHQHSGTRTSVVSLQTFIQQVPSSDVGHLAYVCRLRLASSFCIVYENISYNLFNISEIRSGVCRAVPTLAVDDIVTLYSGRKITPSSAERY
jgi:hypothetical protein